MTKKEIILDYVSRNQKPDETKCPKLRIYWPVVGGMKYLDPSDGFAILAKDNDLDMYTKRQWGEVQEDWVKDGEWIKTRSVSNGYAIYRYIKAEGDLLEIAVAAMDIGRFKKDANRDQREWQFHDYYDREFIFKDDPITVYNKEGEEIHANERGKFYNLQFAKDLATSYLDTTCLNALEMRKWFGKTINLNYAWEWVDAYKKLTPRVVSDKLTQEHDRILALQLSDITGLEQKYPCEVIYKYEPSNKWNNYQNTYIHSSIILGEATSDGGFMIRFLTRKDPFVKGNVTVTSAQRPVVTQTLNRDPFTEADLRVYISPKRDIKIYSKFRKGGDWDWRGGQLYNKPYQTNNFLGSASYSYIANLKDWEKNPVIGEYVKYTQREKNNSDFSFLCDIITNIRNPLVIQFAKKGAKNIAKYIQSYGNAEAKKLFDSKGSKAKIEDCDLTDPQIIELDKYFAGKNSWSYQYASLDEIYRLIKIINPSDKDFNATVKAIAESNNISYRWFLNVVRFYSKDERMKAGQPTQYWELLSGYDYLKYSDHMNYGLKKAVEIVSKLKNESEIAVFHKLIGAGVNNNSMYIPASEIDSIQTVSDIFNIIKKYNINL